MEMFAVPGGPGSDRNLNSACTSEGKMSGGATSNGQARSVTSKRPNGLSA